MQFLVLLISIIVVTMTSIVTLKATDPALYLKLALTFDFIGFSPNVKEEKNRLEQIDLLPLSQEKKDILINHTIFLGANPSMVELAFGTPLTQLTLPATKDSPEIERWVYHFEADINPTALEFNDGKLSAAYTMTKR